jgi:hypothetical protein
MTAAILLLSLSQLAGVDVTPVRGKGISGFALGDGIEVLEKRLGPTKVSEPLARANGSLRRWFQVDKNSIALTAELDAYVEGGKVRQFGVLYHRSASPKWLETRADKYAIEASAGLSCYDARNTARFPLYRDDIFVIQPAEGIGVVFHHSAQTGEPEPRLVIVFEPNRFDLRLQRENLQPVRCSDTMMDPTAVGRRIAAEAQWIRPPVGKVCRGGRTATLLRVFDDTEGIKRKRVADPEGADIWCGDSLKAGREQSMAINLHSGTQVALGGLTDLIIEPGNGIDASLGQGRIRIDQTAPPPSGRSGAWKLRVSFFVVTFDGANAFVVEEKEGTVVHLLSGEALVRYAEGSGEPFLRLSGRRSINLTFRRDLEVDDSVVKALSDSIGGPRPCEPAP